MVQYEYIFLFIIFVCSTSGQLCDGSFAWLILLCYLYNTYSWEVGGKKIKKIF